MNTQTVVINRKNVIKNTNNTKYVYNFPIPIHLENNEICFASLNMYYSWPNIQATYGNNIFTYKWWNINAQLVEVNITIPDGNYSISTLSGYIQSQMFVRGHYLRNSKNNEIVFFISLTENAAYYACQINFTAMYTLSTIGTNFIHENSTLWSLPAVSAYPQVVLKSTNTMKDFLGFEVGVYPNNAPLQSVYKVLGTVTPVVSPVSAINIQCNMCRSDIAIPDNVLYSFSQGNASYGDLLLKEPQNLIWMRVPNGTYSNLELNFLDQDFQPMKILDSQVNFIILIRDL